LVFSPTVLILILISFICETRAETLPEHFQFNRLNQSYENIALKIKEVQSGPLIIRISSPEHRLTLHDHGLEIEPAKRHIHHAQLFNRN